MEIMKEIEALCAEQTKAIRPYSDQIAIAKIKKSHFISVGGRRDSEFFKELDKVIQHSKENIETILNSGN